MGADNGCLIENNTIYSGLRMFGSCGIYLNGTFTASYSVEISHNIIMGYYNGFDDGRVATVLGENNDVYWNLFDYTGEHLSGDISSDPLFCDAENDEFTLHYNSPCMKGHTPSGGDYTIGAHNVGCASGAMTWDSTVLNVSSTEGGVVKVRGDLLVGANQSLSADAGMTLSIDDPDYGSSNYGDYGDTTEIVVVDGGRLDVTFVEFLPAPESSGRWGGIILDGADHLLLEYSTIKGAIRGIDCREASYLDINGGEARDLESFGLYLDGVQTAYVDDWTVRNAQTGIWVDKSSSFVSIQSSVIESVDVGVFCVAINGGQDGQLVVLDGCQVLARGTGVFERWDDSFGFEIPPSLEVSNCDIELISGAEAGIVVMGDVYPLIDPGAVVKLTNNHIDGNGLSSVLHGIFLSMVPPGGQESVVDSNFVEAIPAGKGICVDRFSPTMNANVVEGCKWGVYLGGAEAPHVEPKAGSENGGTIADCTTGIYVNGPENYLVDRVSISSVDSTASVGVYTDGGSTAGTLTGLGITGHFAGIKAFSSGAEYLVNSSISEFKAYGVQAGGGSTIQIGCGASSNGNTIASGRAGVLKYVSVKPPRLSGLGDICAENNYWGASGPSAEKFSSYVDYTPWLSGPPTGPSTQPIAPLAKEVESQLLGITPNPFVSSLAVAVTAPGSVALDVFDIAGRRIRNLAPSPSNPGRFETSWDGRDDAGIEVPAGVYFLRLRTGSNSVTRKAIKVR